MSLEVKGGSVRYKAAPGLYLAFGLDPETFAPCSKREFLDQMQAIKHARSFLLGFVYDDQGRRVWMTEDV